MYTESSYTVRGVVDFVVRHEVFYAPQCELKYGQVSAERLAELATILAVGEWYALVYDNRYMEYVRLYEDGHMEALTDEDRKILFRRGWTRERRAIC